MLYLYLIVLPPEVNITPAEVKVREGERVEFFCSATGVGNNDFTYQWFLNNLPIAGQATPTLVINSASEHNTGDYMCFVSNPDGEIGQSEVARLILGMLQNFNILMKLHVFVNVLPDQSCFSVTVEYTGFSITWNETSAGVTLEAPCTGANLNGQVSSYRYTRMSE